MTGRERPDDGPARDEDVLVDRTGDPARLGPGRWQELGYRARSRWDRTRRPVRVAVVATGAASTAAVVAVVLVGSAGSGSDTHAEAPIWSLRLEQWVQTSPGDSTTSLSTVDRTACLDIDPADPPDRAAQTYLATLVPGGRARSLLRVIDQAGGLCGGQASVSGDTDEIALVRVMTVDDVQVAPFTQDAAPGTVVQGPVAGSTGRAAYVWCRAGEGRVVVAASIASPRSSPQFLVPACARTAQLWT